MRELLPICKWILPLLMVATGAHARGFMETDLAAAFSRLNAPLSGGTTLSSAFGVMGRQVIGFELVENFSVVGNLAGHYIDYAADGIPLTNSGALSAGGSVGIQWGKRAALIRLLVGARTSNVLTESSNELTFSSVLAPEASAVLRAVILPGAGHDIGIGVHGSYRPASLGSGTGATQSHAITAGAEFNIDFIRASVPITLFGLVEYTTSNTSSGTQTNLMFGGGVRFNAILVKPEKN